MLPLWRLLVGVASWLVVSWLLRWIGRSLRILLWSLVCSPIWLRGLGGLYANGCGLKARLLRVPSQRGGEKGPDPQDQADDDQPDRFRPLVVIEPTGVNGVLGSSI